MLPAGTPCFALRFRAFRVDTCVLPSSGFITAASRGCFSPLFITDCHSLPLPLSPSPSPTSLFLLLFAASAPTDVVTYSSLCDLLFACNSCALAALRLSLMRSGHTHFMTTINEHTTYIHTHTHFLRLFTSSLVMLSCALGASLLLISAARA